MTKPRWLSKATAVNATYPCGLEKLYKNYRQRRMFEKLHCKHCVICQKEYQITTDNDNKITHNFQKYGQRVYDDHSEKVNDKYTVSKTIGGGSSAIYRGGEANLKPL